MKFRRNLFTVLALLVLVVACVWVTAGLSAVSENETETEAEEAGQAIGASIGVGMIACITVPLFALFALLGWRNSVGLRSERRHQEQIEALRHQQR